jgi:hypothetical protein
MPASRLHGNHSMWLHAAAAIDFAHALLMAFWVLGLPLLFWRRWPRLSRVAACYALAFVAVSQISHWTLGECFLTTLARVTWERAALTGAAAAVSDEWFTVRIARSVFHMAPSQRAITIVFEAMIVVTALGAARNIRAHG